MARPRYQINPEDWFDCLDWLDYQLQQPHWIHEPDHPIHSFGLAVLRECVVQWRDIDRPTQDLCASAQEILQDSLTMEDWSRLRKSLSARKRRRTQRKQQSKAVNITLTPAAHEALTQFRLLSGAATFSEALEDHLQEPLAQLRQLREQRLTSELKERLAKLKASEVVALVEHYLEMTLKRRSLANSCKIAHQLFLKRPDRESLRLVRDRFIEDLIWNDSHLKIAFSDLIDLPQA